LAVVLIQSPGLTPVLLIVLFVYQFVIVNVLMPRLMSDAVGLHPLLVFAAILFSVKIAGFWGAFFGIPIAGVLWAMLVFFFDEWRGQARASSADPLDE
jgi:predicted PurR-regulated permease PerM